jgi:hypothetical protein
MKNDACTSATVKQSLDRLGALLPAPSATLAKDVHNYLGCNTLTGQP